MSILTINLKQLYQRRGLWLAYGMFGLFVWLSIMVALDDPKAGRGGFIGLIVLAFLIGMAAAVQQIEILTKPMAFCLPRHRQTLRRFILTVGVAFNAAGALLFLLYPGLSILQWPAVLASVFAAGLIFYLAGVFLIFRVSQPLNFVALLSLVFVGGRLLGLHIWLERAIVMHPVVMIGLGSLSAAVMWGYLNRAGLARRSCAQPSIAFADLFDREKLRRSPQARSAAPWARLKDHPRPWVENFFLARMGRSRPLGTARYAWGAIYGSFAMTLSQWTNLLVLAVAMTLVLGCFRSHPVVIMFAAMPVVAGSMQMSYGVLYTSMLTAGGRRERFVATLAVVAAGTGLVMVLMGIIVALSVPLAHLIPTFHVYGQTITFRVVNTRVLYGPLFLLPFVTTVYLICYRRLILSMIFLMVLSFVMVMLSHIWRVELEPLVSAPTAALLAAFCWLFFAVVMSVLTGRRCLIR